MENLESAFDKVLSRALIVRQASMDGVTPEVRYLCKQWIAMSIYEADLLGTMENRLIVEIEYIELKIEIGMYQYAEDRKLIEEALNDLYDSCLNEELPVLVNRIEGIRKRISS